MNITLLNNRVLKIYNSDENSALKTLTLRFSLSDYTFDEIDFIFKDPEIKEALKRIVKTTSSAKYVATFENYTDVISKAVEKVEVLIEKTEEIPSIDENGAEITTTITTTEPQEIDLIVVTLKHEDPTKVIVEKLNQQINPTIDVVNCTLDELKKYRQAKNKEAMNDYFRKNPLLHTDGLYYGVEDEDRREMSEEFMGYTLEAELDPNAVLEWHSKGSACTPRTQSEFSSIAIAIRNYTKPHFRQMQQIKENIFSASTKEDVLAIKIFGE